MKQKISKWMYGRYGIDRLAVAELILIIVILAVTSLTGLLELQLVGLAIAAVLWIRIFFRVFSKDTEERRLEFIRCKSVCRNVKLVWKNRMEIRHGRKGYRTFKCPGCKRGLLVPKHRGRVSVTCPKCRTNFMTRR